MRFARDHTHNGVHQPAGAAFVGDTNTARFLYHRGVLEPDGAPGDDLVTGPKTTNRQVWDVDIDDRAPDTSTTTSAWGAQEE